MVGPTGSRLPGDLVAVQLRELLQQAARRFDPALRPKSREAGAQVEQAWSAEIADQELEALRAVLTRLVDKRSA